MVRWDLDAIKARNKDIINRMEGGTDPVTLAKEYDLTEKTVTDIYYRNKKFVKKKYERPELPVSGGKTLEQLRAENDFGVGEVVQVKNESGKYIKATVKRVTDWQIFASGVDGYTHAISFQSLANEPNQIKGAKM